MLVNKINERIEGFCVNIKLEIECKYGRLGFLLQFFFEVERDYENFEIDKKLNDEMLKVDEEVYDVVFNFYYKMFYNVRLMLYDVM